MIVCLTHVTHSCSKWTTTGTARSMCMSLLSSCSNSGMHVHSLWLHVLILNKCIRRPMETHTLSHTSFLLPNTRTYKKKTQIVDADLLITIHQRFQELDTDGSGRLTREDFVQLVMTGGNDGGGVKRGSVDGREGGGSHAPSSSSSAADAASFASVGVDLEGEGVVGGE